jgi:hypothetical protein
MSIVVSRSFSIPLLVAATIAIVSGLAHGWLDGRWVDKPNVEAIGAKLKELPNQFGDWAIVENQKLPDSALSQLQCYGYTLQVYQNAKTGRRVNVAVLFGPRGPIAVHTPEICYSGQGVTPSDVRSKEVIVVDSEEHTLWRVNLQSKRDSKPELEAYYAWSDGSKWQAADYPRAWLTGQLYKIQLACQPASDGEVADALLFLQQFLPILQPLLVKTS